VNVVLIILTIYFFIAGILGAFFTMYAFINRKSIIAKTIFILGFLLTLSLFSYLFELNSDTLEELLFWNHAQYLALPFIPTIWLYVSFRFTRYKIPFKGFNVLVWIIPIITFILVHTSSLHSWYYTSATMVEGLFNHALELQKGFWFYVQMIYAMGMILYATIVYFLYSLKCSLGAKKVANRLVFASIWPWVGILLGLFPEMTMGILFAAVFMPISIVIFGTVLFNRYLISIKPIANDIFFDVANQGILVFDYNNYLIDVNPYALKSFPFLKQYLNYPLDEIINFVPEIGKIKGVEHLDSFEFQGKYFQTHLSLIKDSFGYSIGSLFTFIDVSENHRVLETLKKNQSHIEYLSVHDQMTGLHNRHYLEDYIANLKPEDYPLGVIFIDMNNLKMTNDSKGHLAGDLLIKNTADLIVTVCNSNDLTVRIGGDEFLILIRNSTEMDIREKMKQLQEKAKDKGISFALGHSIKTQKVSFDEVYRQAEDRMYMDKDLKR